MASLYITASLFIHASASSQHGAVAFLSPLPNRPLTKRHAQKTFSTSNVNEMPLPQLLDTLHRFNIRYGPNANREDLEDLLRGHLRENSDIGSNSCRVSDVVDAVVVSDEMMDQKTNQHEVNNGRRRSRRSVAAAAETRFKRRSRATNRSEHGTNRQVYQNQSNMSDKKRRRKSPQRPLRRNILKDNKPNEDIIDAVFDLPHQSTSKNTYDNGLQIFLMGFIEAGKTAAELTLDATKQSLPFYNQDDKLWFDEELGRDVLDVDVVDYRQSYVEYDRRGERTRRGRGQYDSRRHGRRYREELGYRGNRSPTPLTIDHGRLESKISNSTQHIQQRPVPRSRNPTSKRTDESKTIYGLGYTHEETLEQRHIHHHKQQWKDRLRRKFDAALGLESTVTSTKEQQESYYDSWKRNMREMDDSHKDRLRRKMTDDETVPVNTASVRNEDRIPNNRRARMRAAKNGITNHVVMSTSIQRPKQSSIFPRTKTYKKSKLRLKEKPFWKQRGTIASLLFDNDPPSKGSGVHKNKRSSLEQILLSPTRREKTLTSLLLYITRSSLSIFGKLCRWAGVRGTIPQPIVVVTVCAVILSLRNQKMLSLGLTLLAIRMIGEFVHGSVYGNEFWDDEYDVQAHEWVVDDNDVGPSVLH